MIPKFPVILAFSPSHLTITFESTDSSFSTNDASSVTAEFLDGYLRSCFPKEYSFVRNVVSSEQSGNNHIQLSNSASYTVLLTGSDVSLRSIILEILDLDVYISTAFLGSNKKNIMVLFQEFSS